MVYFVRLWAFNLQLRQIFMGVLVFNLRGVPEDEAVDVRKLLDEHDIAFYETSAGFFGLGVSAIWLHDKADKDKAKELIDEYQNKRSEEAQSEHQKEVESHQQLTFWHILIQHPLRTIGFIFALLVVGYISMVPFIWFTGQ